MIQVVVVRDPFNLGEREVFEAEPATIGELVPDDLRLEYGVSALLNGVPIPFDDWDDTTCDEGTLGFVLLPQELATIITVFKYLTAALLISGAARAIFGVPRDNVQLGDRSSPLYNFDGIYSSRAEGIPLPLIFGRVRYGGNVINEYVRSIGIPEVSTLYQQLSFGEGPIKSISGLEADTPGATPFGSELGEPVPPTIYINGNAADNFDEITGWVRLGSNEQEVVPGFEAVRTRYSADFLLTAPTDPAASNNAYATGYSFDDWYDTTNDAYWTTYGEAIDITAQAVDSGLARLYFERGLFTQNASTGSYDSSYYAYQVRYRELDSSGSPIITGGEYGDGWVRLPPKALTSAKSTEPFYLEAPIPFYDPQTYEHYTPGKAMKGEATSVVSGSSHDSASYLFWVKPTGAGFLLRQSGSNDYHRLSLNSDGSLTYFSYYNFGSGTDQISFTTSATIPFGAWSQIALVLSDDIDHDDLLWINGQLVEVWRSRHTGLLGGGTTHTLGDISAPNNLFDQFVCYSADSNVAGKINGSQVLAQYNGGAGTLAYLGGKSASGAATFDFNATQDPDAPGTRKFADFTLTGSSTAGVEEGWVVDPTQTLPTAKRSRYRVEIVRINRDSTNTNTFDDVRFVELQAVTENELTYPNSPILSIQAGATEQLSGSAPSISSIIEGLKVPVWDGVSTSTPSISDEYSQNPAWIALGILTNKRWGLGSIYQLEDCLSPSLYSWAQYCDEIVYAGSRQFVCAAQQNFVEDIFFDDSIVDLSTGETRGGMLVQIKVSSSDTSLPPDWEVGAYLRLHGYVVPGAPTDINNGSLGSSTAGGYEIYEINRLTSSGGIEYWQIAVYWDRLEESNPWTTNTWLLTTVPTATITSATLELGEKRHEFNGVFDREQSAWDAILEVAGVGRAIPIREGTKVRWKYQYPRTPVGVLSTATIERDSFRINYTDGSQKANALDVTIADKDQDYELSPVTVLDPTIENTSSLDEIRKESRNYVGITRRGQAQRQALFELNINRLLKRSGKFTLGAEGLPFEPGDLVRLSHDLVPRGTGGRVIRASYPNAGYMVEMLSDNNAFDGSSWTSSGVTVTANTSSNPFGTATEADRLADSNSSHNYVEQAGSETALNTDWVSLGIWIKPGTAAKSLVALVLPGGTASYLVTWSTGTAEVYGAATMPEKRRAVHVQQFGSTGWYRVTVSGYHLEADGAAAPIARIFPASDTSGSSGAATGNIEVWGAHLSYGRYAAPGSGAAIDRTVAIDRDLTIAAGTNKLYVRDFRDGLGEGTIDSSLCPAGNYVPGDLVVTTGSLGVSTQEDGTWLLCKSGDELVVEILSSRVNQDLTRECDWIEYNAAIFDDVPTAESDSALLRFKDGDDEIPPLLEAGGDEDMMPGPTAISGLKDVWVRRGPGQFVPTLYIGLEYDRPSKPFIQRTELFWRPKEGLEGGWQYAGSTTGLDPQATITLPQGTTADTIEVCAQSVTLKGRRRAPGTSHVYTVRLRGLTAPPETPTSVAAAIAENQAIYGYTVTGDDLLSVECRRGGGWILGQQVFREEARQRDGARRVGPTLDWAGSSTATPTLRFAAMNTMGHYGVPATLAFNPTVDGDTLPFDGTAPDQAWESYDPNGWEKAVPTPGSALIGPEFEENAAGELIYTAASTSLAWETAYTSQRDQGAILTLEQWRQPRRHFVEAWVEAYAENEETWQDATWAYGDILYDRWTWEGPRSTVPEEPANPELEIQFRVNRDGTSAGWGDWRDYTPSIYSFVDIQFRLRVRRHHANQNVRILKFHTRITPPRMSLEDQTPMREFILHEMFQ